MEILGIYLLFIFVFNIVTGPFMIGKEKDKFTARGWLIGCILVNVPGIIYIFWTMKG